MGCIQLVSLSPFPPVSPVPPPQTPNGFAHIVNRKLLRNVDTTYLKFISLQMTTSGTSKWEDLTV